MRLIEDDRLPSDVVRKEYSESRHALCCLNCGLESEFAPRLPDAKGCIIGDAENICVRIFHTPAFST
jgi:hypothetical protein